LVEDGFDLKRLVPVVRKKRDQGGVGRTTIKGVGGGKHPWEKTR